jgi:hypothetical protein
MKRLIGLVSITFILAACGGDSGDGDGGLFEPNPECEGAEVDAFAGDQQSVISFLEIGALEDGFDLDGDGMPDNKLAPVATLANDALADSFTGFDLILPLEFFDFPEVGADECVKFAIYLGSYKADLDMDGEDTADERGDCNDNDAAINPNAAEIPDNFKDDNCNGLADETVDGMGNTIPSANTDDMDGDGLTIADGDCDDTNDAVGGVFDICGDGLDNDCDGAADFGLDAGGVPACTPFDDSPDFLAVDPLSLDESGAPLIAFVDGVIRDNAGSLQLTAGPSLFVVSVPIFDDVALDLRISGATIEADVVAAGSSFELQNARLGGVIDAVTADNIKGIEVEQIGLSAEDSLLDAVFANVLGTVLGLNTFEAEDPSWDCRVPDIDVDRDGIEAFCDSTPDDGISRVDEVDGAGNVTTECSAAVNDDGTQRFVDGISVELNFATKPAMLIQ